MKSEKVPSAVVVCQLLVAKFFEAVMAETLQAEFCLLWYFNQNLLHALRYLKPFLSLSYAYFLL